MTCSRTSRACNRAGMPICDLDASLYPENPDECLMASADSSGEVSCPRGLSPLLTPPPLSSLPPLASSDASSISLPSPSHLPRSCSYSWSGRGVRAVPTPASVATRMLFARLCGYASSGCSRPTAPGKYVPLTTCCLLLTGNCLPPTTRHSPLATDY